MTADPIETVLYTDVGAPGDDAQMVPYEIAQDTPERPWRIQSKEDFTWCISLRWEHEQRIAALKRRIRNLEVMISDEQRQIDRWSYRFGLEVMELTKDMLDGTGRKSLQTDWGKVGFRLGRASLRVRDSKAAIEWARTHAPDAIQTDERLVTTPLQGRTDLPVELFEQREARDHFFLDQAPKV